MNIGASGLGRNFTGISLRDIRTKVGRSFSGGGRSLWAPAAVQATPLALLFVCGKENASGPSCGL